MTDASEIPQLSGGAIDTLWCLFRNGPTWDGDIPSKAGRADLIDLGLAFHRHGHASLTPEGLAVCVAKGYPDKREGQRRRDGHRSYLHQWLMGKSDV